MTTIKLFLRVISISRCYVRHIRFKSFEQNLRTQLQSSHREQIFLYFSIWLMQLHMKQNSKLKQMLFQALDRETSLFLSLPLNWLRRVHRLLLSAHQAGGGRRSWSSLEVRHNQNVVIEIADSWQLNGPNFFIALGLFRHAGEMRYTLPTIPNGSRGPTDSNLIDVHPMLMAATPSGNLEIPGCETVKNAVYAHQNLIESVTTPSGLKRIYEFTNSTFSAVMHPKNTSALNQALLKLLSWNNAKIIFDLRKLFNADIIISQASVSEWQSLTVRRIRNAFVDIKNAEIKTFQQNF